jgi:hypothetical protein
VLGGMRELPIGDALHNGEDIIRRRRPRTDRRRARAEAYARTQAERYRARGSKGVSLKRVSTVHSRICWRLTHL